MPWEAATPSTGSWASQPNERTYAASYYAVDDYVVDEVWTLDTVPVQEWSQAA